MKALSLWPEWAMPVALGQKTVECRTWKTSYRGPLLVCASKRPLDGMVHGRALCVVDLLDVVPFEFRHLRDSLLMPSEMPDGAFAWLLGNARIVEPFEVKGRQSLFDVPDELVKVVGEPSPEIVSSLFLPIIHRSRRSEADEVWREIFYELGWPTDSL